MGSVVPLKKSANSAYHELKNLLGDKLHKVENLIQEKLRSEVNLIQKMSDHHLESGLPAEPMMPVSLTCGTIFFFLKIENIFLMINYILITVKN